MISRRDFLRKSARTGATFALGGYLARAYGTAASIGPLAAAAIPETDRVLVIVRLDGGNDGLNTVVNFENDAYYSARPTLNISKTEALHLTDTQGLHPALAGMHGTYQDGRMLVVQGVGYPNPNRSHFRSTDIWMTASEADEFLSTGWLGRYFEALHPSFPDQLPEHPVAIDIGPVLSLSLLGKNGAMGIALRDPRQFFALVNLGNKIIDDTSTPTPAGYELDFVRQVNVESLQYSQQVRDAGVAGKNAVEYPDSTLADQLALIARLIDGGLKSRVFLVSQRGYDTHANQLSRHSALLTDLDSAITAFQADLAARGHDKRVLGMTISEFGRRVKENGSAGTDHGTSAPMFLFGPHVNGGILGPAPHFGKLDSRGDFIHDYDFRQVYASILSRWFEVPNDAVDLVFPTRPETLAILPPTSDLASIDFTGDGRVDFDDFTQFAQAYGTNDPRFDLDGDGSVGFTDFISFARAFGKR